jgi:hypothetical protein
VLPAASDYHKHASTSEKHVLKLLHTRITQILGEVPSDSDVGTQPSGSPSQIYNRPTCIAPMRIIQCQGQWCVLEARTPSLKHKYLLFPRSFSPFFSFSPHCIAILLSSYQQLRSQKLTNNHHHNNNNNSNGSLLWRLCPAPLLACNYLLA